MTRVRDAQFAWFSKLAGLLWIYWLQIFERFHFLLSMCVMTQVDINIIIALKRSKKRVHLTDIQIGNHLIIKILKELFNLVLNLKWGRKTS